jgi:glycosyltransferase involved in cell wall biosynthesis
VGAAGARLSSPAPTANAAENPMSASCKVIVVMPAYNAALTLERTYKDLPREVIDHVILVDDVSRDETVEIAQRLGLKVIVHVQNRGYGGNQKTCYIEALRDGADVVVMLHPDYQYDSRLVPQLIAPIQAGEADLMLGSRLLAGGTLAGGMPRWKYLSNRFLTIVENAALGQHLSECHTGFRAYSRRLLETIPFLLNSDDFVFDTEVIAQTVAFGFRIAEIAVPTRYFAEASSVNFRRGVVYGLSTLAVMARFVLDRWGIRRSPQFRQPLEQVISRYHAAQIIRDGAANSEATKPDH